MTIKKMTPNLYTDDVAACANFWVDRMQFTKTVEVPEGNNLAFVALEKGPVELMYGSYNSLQKGLGDAAPSHRGPGFLFIEVDDLDAALAAMDGAPVLKAVHKTFYGATEFTVQDPAGHIITFAQF
jgi:catechol 2,3-dioxygenase-like lactoylglutathione lyase family enzyme